MLKYSFRDERNVYQRFYGTLIMFSYFFLKAKLCVSVYVGKSLACVYSLVEKMLSFSCVCSLKMGLLKRLSPVLFDSKQKIFDSMAIKVLSLLINCKMLVSAKSSLKAYERTCIL